MILLLQYTLTFASVLILVALGGCFSEHSGVINLGLEGVMIMGALGGALAMMTTRIDASGNTVHVAATEQQISVADILLRSAAAKSK